MLVRSRLASHEEPEASEALAGVFADEGIRVVQQAAVNAVARDEDSGKIVVSATVDGGRETFLAAKLLVAAGRRPVTAELNLDQVGVETGTSGEIEVNSRLATSNPRVWAAGDVTGQRDFVYVAAAHGALAVENAFTDTVAVVDYRNLPRVTFTSPAIGSVGMTEQEAVAAGISSVSQVLSLEFVPRAQANRDTRGFIKVVADGDSGQILGISAVAKDAGDLAAAGVYILEGAMTTAQVAAAWSPYLTMTEGIRIACKAFTTDVAKLSCCA
ncbi:UNVERIFIED_ORG: pyridine nucleotide-disulfide oxidoreductase [Nocardia globerula]|uniref:Pyridine nucleotide-disulfide oxidoreductase n=2 Tax=Nocardiaceae TaxID=85025 RepID=A0A652YHV5_NOCGL